MACDVCKIIENKKEFHLIYEDEICFVILHESPALEGHCLVIPKKHIPILEETDDETIGHLLNISNKISTAIFETIGAFGTNILINNGLSASQELPHLIINVIPRKENDGINFEWSAKKSSENELKTIQSILKTYSDFIYSGKEIKKENISIKEETNDKKEQKKTEDYLIKGLKRMP
ncbi:MAG: HIT family protein [Candidatus Woesearchaeota archaeon]